jgi:hypothetical protein
MKSKNVLFSIVMLAIMLCVIEGLFFATGKVLQSKWAMWRPPTSPAVARVLYTYDEYLKRRDPVLGWPFPQQYGDDLDVNGAQRNSHFPNGAQTGSCVSLYGDSFTEGGDTSSREKNWGNLLSDRLGCYVANFGFGGYGTDQAQLRFEKNRNDPSSVVIFGFHTEDVLRNLTRVRDLQNYSKWYALKPRYVLNDRRELELVPIPVLTEEEYLRTVGLAGDVLPLAQEDFQPGGRAGVVKLQFPYTLSVVRNMLRFYGFRSRVLRRPEWMDFLETGHALHGLEITAGITSKFVKIAANRGKTPLVLVLPHPLDFKYFQKSGHWPYQSLLNEYARTAIPFFDFGPFLLSAAHARGKNIEEFFGPTGHYNDDGNALVASFVYDRLQERALVPAQR